MTLQPSSPSTSARHTSFFIIVSHSAMLVEHSLPFQRNLLITTPDAIHLYSQKGDRVLFDCEGADGIVNARAAPDNSSLLAIASRQIVLLHDTIHSREKQHKLEGKEVNVPPRNVICDSYCGSRIHRVYFSSRPTHAHSSSTPQSIPRSRPIHCPPATFYHQRTRIR